MTARRWKSNRRKTEQRKAARLRYRRAQVRNRVQRVGQRVYRQRLKPHHLERVWRPDAGIEDMPLVHVYGGGRMSYPDGTEVMLSRTRISYGEISGSTSWIDPHEPPRLYANGQRLL